MDPLLSRITIDSSVCHGKPCIRGLRYPVEWLLELLSSGMSHDDVLADYLDMERDDFRAVFAFAAKVTQTKPKTSVPCWRFCVLTAPRGGAHPARTARAARSGEQSEALASVLFLSALVALGAGGGIGASRLRLQRGCTQHRSTSTRRKKIAWVGFHDSKRYTRRRPLRTIWHGSRTNACTKVLNSKRSTHCLSAR